MKTITKTITTTVEVKTATLEDLETFLSNNGALRKYVRNLLHKKIGARLTLNTLLDVRQIMISDELVSKKLISGAFLWSDTPEGDEYWAELDTKFFKWCKENNIEAFEVE